MTAKSPQTDADLESIDTKIVEELDFEGADRHLSLRLDRLIFLISVVYSLFHLAVLNFFAIDEWVYRVLHVNVGAFLAMVMLHARKNQKASEVPLYDWLLAAAAIGCSIYVMWELDELLGRTGVVTTTGDFICGFAGTLIVIEFARRLSGLILPGIALIFVAYVFTGPLMPGVFHHSGFDVGDTFSFLYSQEGIFGLTVAASSRYIILFVAFAVFLNVCGTGTYFMDLAMSLVGWSRGGPAKVSVLSGLLFGSVSGSAVANVVATGTFTIPMMKRAGYPSDNAGAVEAAASTGGQLAPPVMGAGAFIMAEITGIPYSDIVIAATLPCLLFYFSIFVAVDYQAVNLGVLGLPRDQLPKLSGLLGDLFLLLPLYVLLYLLISGYSIIGAGTWGLASTLLVLLCQRLKLSSRWLVVPLVLYVALPISGLAVNISGLIATMVGALILLFIGAQRHGMAGVGDSISHLFKTTGIGLSQTARNSLQLISVMACAGIIVGVLGLTGLGGRLSAVILAIAGDSQGIAFVLAMIISLILGMGMPTTAAYAIAAAVVAPALQSLGVAPLPAHMFVFYSAVISAITPPVAIAAFAAAAISRGRPWTTSILAMRLAVAAFAVPFLFYVSPEILMQGPLWDAAQVFVAAAIGIAALMIGVEGQLFGRIDKPSRALCVFAGLSLMLGPPEVAVMAAAIFALIGIWRFKRRSFASP